MRDDKIIHHGSSQSRTTFLDTGFSRLDRTMLVRKPMRDIDVYGGFWFCGLIDVVPGKLKIEHGERQVFPAGKTAVLITPFSLVTWCIGLGKFEFTAYVGSAALPENLNGAPKFCRPEFLPTDCTSHEDLFAFMSEQNWHAIVPKQPTHPIATAMKTMIDQSFKDDLTLAQICRDLDTPQAVASRLFKKEYGLTPVSYRNRLKVFFSLFHITSFPTNVTSACHEAGFHELSQFNRQFKKTVLTVPSSFRHRVV